MRRFRSSSPFFLLVAFCLMVGLNALFRVGFHFETRVFKYHRKVPPPPPPSNDRPWFMRGGIRRPLPSDPPPALWPHESGGDRIVNQLMYIPPATRVNRTRVILLMSGRRGWGGALPMGGGVFSGCPAHNCALTDDKRRHLGTADLLLFKDRFTQPPPHPPRPPQQIWLLFVLECPLHTQSFSGAAGLFNWTASYRRDSDIVTPYEKWVPYPDTHYQVRPPPDEKGRGQRKGGVAWFVSNCAARNRRLQYARELGRHIQVDLFGRCGGRRTCPRSSAQRCFGMLSAEYKFYLAFENSNCRDYITEKFFDNGLGHDVLPIVMGARREDYLRSAPPHSYLHVEDFSGPSHLASYLKELDANHSLYSQYFQWRGRGEFIDTRFWCRLCALLHAPRVPKVYTDIEEWWAGKGTCTPHRWSNSTPP